MNDVPLLVLHPEALPSPRASLFHTGMPEGLPPTGRKSLLLSLLVGGAWVWGPGGGGGYIEWSFH